MSINSRTVDLDTILFAHAQKTALQFLKHRGIFLRYAIFQPNTAKACADLLPVKALDGSLHNTSSCFIDRIGKQLLNRFSPVALAIERGFSGVTLTDILGFL